MSTNKNQDAFAYYQTHADTFFNDIKKSVPQYHQSITNYQQELLCSCETAVKACIDANAKYFGKINLPDSVIKSGDTVATDFTNALKIQQKTILFGFDIAQQAIKVLNDGVKVCNDYLDTWFSLKKN